MTRPVELIAHRGANREALENTLPAFALALELGVDGIELDVQLTRDRVPVIHHDPVLHDGSAAPIASLDLNAIRARHAIPTLADVIDLVDARCRLYIEIKNPAAVDLVCDQIADRGEWCAVHSFDHRVPQWVARRDVRISTGILVTSRLIDTSGAMRAAGARDLWQQAAFIDQELTEEVHAASGRVIAWTVNDAPQCELLVSTGVDAICTDSVREMRSLLGR